MKGGRANNPLLNSTPLRSWVREAGNLGVVATLCLACGSSKDVLVGYNRGNAEGGQSGATSTVSTSSVTRGGSTAGTLTTTGGTSSYCANGGPAIRLPVLGGCTNDLAKRVFLFAICSCSDFVSTGALITDSLDSRTSDPLDVGGSIGVNGRYQAGATGSQLGGSLWALGDVKFGQHDIAGDLQCARSLTVTAESRVHQNAYVMGDIAAPTLTIDGILRRLEGTATDVFSARGGIQTLNSMSVLAPCDCQDTIDIATIVSQFERLNDNASQYLSSSAFTGAMGTVERSLPCGSYYFDSFSGDAAITLHLTGKTLIAVGGEVSNSGGLVFDLAPDAELDLFVGGDIALSGPVVLGNPRRPAATRVYVGGQVAFSSNLALYANWYVPNHPVVVAAHSEFWGAIFAQSLQVSGSLTVHYDRAVLDLPSCTSSGQTCNSCRDCANPTPACRNGGCTVCQDDNDCCPPLHCNQGFCATDTVLR